VKSVASLRTRLAIFVSRARDPYRGVAWLEKALATLSRKSETAIALRAVLPGPEELLFGGSNDGSERAGATYTLTGSAKLNSLDPELCRR
jgi:hypothetical protein